MSNLIHCFGEERRERDKGTNGAREREKWVKDEDTKKNIVCL
jgi:hypothetical protein